MKADAAPARRIAPWLPLYLLLLLGATLSPPFLRCGPSPLRFSFGAQDVVLNVLVFLPLGLGLRSVRWLAVLAIAAALSGGIELVQRWLLRDPNGVDFLANLLGAAIGRALPLPRLPRRWLRVPLVAAAAGVLASALAAAGRTLPADFRNWQPFPLTLFNEPEGGRPWRGQLAEVAIYDRAVAPDDFPLLAASDAAPPWTEGGPVLWLRLAGPIRGRLDGPDGPAPLALAPERGAGDSAGLTSEGRPLHLPAAAARHVYERLVAAGRLGLYARLRPSEAPRGPRRIVTLSPGPAASDFSLNQHLQDLEMRVRTPGNGPNGSRMSARTRSGPMTAGWHDVWALFDGRVSRIYVDGRCQGEGYVELTRAPRVIAERIVPTMIAATALPGLAAASWMGRRSRRRRLLAHGAAGALAWLTLFLAGCWAHLPGFGGWALLIGLASLAGGAPAALALHGDRRETVE